MPDSTRTEVIQKTIRNAEKDRERLLGHITRLSLVLGGGPEDEGEKERPSGVAYKENGGTLVKLMEGLQRSNEQLIKIAGVMQKEPQFTAPKEEEDFDPDDVYKELEGDDDGKNSTDDRRD
jgi:hypothetical protein